MEDVSHSGQPGPATLERPWQTAAIVRRQDAHACVRGAYVSGVMDAVLYLEQLADAQVDQNVLARDAICDLIRDFVALSVSNVLERFQHVLPRLVDRDRCRAGKHSRQRVTR